MVADPLREKLFRKITEKSFQKGTFHLSSGKKSAYYFDLKKTTCDPEGLHWICALFYKALEKQFSENENLLLSGLTLGADPLLTGLSYYAFLKGKHWPVCIVRKQAKMHGTEQFLEGTIQKNLKVYVLEDVTTTGKSAFFAVEKLRFSGLKPVGVFSVIDRGEGAPEFFKKQGLPFYSIFHLNEFL